jgi:NADH dehydrogenase
MDADGVLVAGERIPSKTVIWTAGVTASPAGQWLGAETDRAGRVKVEPDLSVPGHANVFVIGDTMALMDGEGRPLPGVAPVAIQQGEYVARLIRRRVKGEPAPPPFHYRDKGNLATVGRSFAILDIHGFKLSGLLAWVLWLFIHILYLIGFRNRLVVLTDWAWNYFTFQRGARVITQAAPVIEAQAAEERQDLAATR